MKLTKKRNDKLGINGKQRISANSKRAEGKGNPLQRPLPLGCSRMFMDYALTYCIARWTNQQLPAKGRWERFICQREVTKWPS